MTDDTTESPRPARTPPSERLSKALAYEWRAHRAFWLGLALLGLAAALIHAAFEASQASAPLAEAFASELRRNIGHLLILGGTALGAASSFAYRSLCAAFPKEKSVHLRALARLLTIPLLALLCGLGLLAV